MPLFFPIPQFVQSIAPTERQALREVLKTAGLACRASGPWTNRQVVISPMQDSELCIQREPGDWGCVLIGVPFDLDEQDQARYAVAALAYGLMDLVARQSIAGASWARPSMPRGRALSGRAQTGAQRQRAYRARKAQAKAEQ